MSDPYMSPLENHEGPDWGIIGVYVLWVVLVLIIVFLCDCGHEHNPCDLDRFKNITGYEINVDTVSPEGFQIDSSGRVRL